LEPASRRRGTRDRVYAGLKRFTGVPFGGFVQIVLKN
jgi:hypothetical protein